MLRDSKESKQERSYVLTGEYIKTLIDNYYQAKRDESSSWYQIQHSTSVWMRVVERFYRTNLNMKEGPLTDGELFDLAKIAFFDNLKLGSKSRLAKSYLLQYYNLNVIAALLASGEFVSLLRPYFAAMCASPNNASNISYAVLLLDAIQKDAARLGINNQIFAYYLQGEISINPNIAADFVAIVQQQQSNKAPVFPSKNEKIQDEIDGLIKKDRMLYILTMLKNANKLSDESLDMLQAASKQQLMSIASNIYIGKECPLKIIKNELSPKLPSSFFDPVVRIHTIYKAAERKPSLSSQYDPLRST